MYRSSYWLFCFLIIAHQSAVAAVQTEEINYSADGLTMKGFLAYDDKYKAKRPGVLVVHEWWGQNDYARKRARMLAKMGYTAFALDMYGNGKIAAHPDNAGKFSSEVAKNMAVAQSRFMAGLKVLKAHKTTDSDRIAAIGYCFGGGMVLEMARRGVDLNGVVSFHGSLASTTPVKKGAIKAKILVAHGQDDPFIKPEHIVSFKEDMKNADAKFRFIAYPGAKHSFTNPDADRLGKKFSLPLAYDKKADQASWQEMQRFFDRIFGQFN